MRVVRRSMVAACTGELEMIAGQTMITVGEIAGFVCRPDPRRYRHRSQGQQSEEAESQRYRQGRAERSGQRVGDQPANMGQRELGREEGRRSSAWVERRRR